MKKSLLTIRKFRSPRCYKGIKHLPAEYKAKKSTWMIAPTFEECLRKWDIELTRHKRKIILFVDNCSAHPHIQDLDSIEFVFLPPNATSVIQLCDQGIIRNMKTYYQKMMAKHIVQCIDSGCSWKQFKC